MKQPIVIVGIGELGGVFSRAFLRNGLPVYPVTRSMNISEQASRIHQPELVLKNVFVLTINIAGMVLQEGTTTETLWTKHNELARTIAANVIDIQEWLTEAALPRKKLIDGLAEGVYGDPQHICKGRAARGRLTRVLDIADEAGLKIPRIRELQARLKLVEH
jgi:hypothetical protein